MKTTFFRKIFIFIVLILSFGFNSSFAENRTLDDIKKEIQVLKNKFENTDDINIKKEINNDVEELLNQISDNNLEVYNFSYRNGNYNKCSSWSSNLKAGDVILFKYSDESFMQDFFGGYKHAAVMYDSSIVLDTGSFSPDKSGKNNISVVIDECKKGKYKHIVILKMGLNSFQIKDFKNYIDNYLLDKPYSTGPSSNKQTRFTFYCSLLVWNAHFNSGKYIDMDYDGGFFVRPIDLLFSNTSESNDYIYF